MVIRNVSNMKRRFAPSVKSRIGTIQRKEFWMRYLIMNILVTAGEEVERKIKSPRSAIGGLSQKPEMAGDSPESTR